jgi:hypothetical protein
VLGEILSDHGFAESLGRRARRKEQPDPDTAA